MSGKNKFQLIVEPGPTPSQTFKKGRPDAVVPPKFFARMRLMQMPRGTFPEDLGVQILLDINFRPPAGTLLAVPVVIETEGEAPPWIPRWSWLEAQPLSDSQGIQTFVINFLARISQSLGEGDPEPYIAAARTRFEEISAAYQLPVEQQIEGFRRQFARLSAESGFQMQPIIPEIVDLRFCGAGRVIDCVDKGWKPLLRSVPRADGLIRYTLPAKVAFFNGEVSIIR